MNRFLIADVILRPLQPNLVHYLCAGVKANLIEPNGAEHAAYCKGVFPM